jgi:phosphoribosylformylglycinamidine synthase subunit PurS
MPLVKITIMLKPALLDAQGRVVQGALHSLGYSEVEKVRVGKSIEILVPDSDDLPTKVKEMCDKLLANPVIEDYVFEVSNSETS